MVTVMEESMSYRVQVFEAESGFFLNTNHKSENLDELKRLVASGIFDGIRYRVVDEPGNEVQVDHVPRERNAPLTIDDIARALQVPVVKRFEDLCLPGSTDPEDNSS
jgi:hypothetical protein